VKASNNRRESEDNLTNVLESKRGVLDKSEQEREAELVRGCREGEVAAFQALFLRYGDMMQVIAARMALDEHMRKDIFQEAAKLIMLHFGSFNGKSALATWLYRVTVNTALKLLRKEKRYTYLAEPDSIEAGGNPATSLERKDMVRHLLNGLARLPKRQKECASMFYFADMSVAEIAAGLSMNEGAVKIALFKARGNITQTLRRKGFISCE
jgi:RNA polymerase sigma-70 factor, ECF subfamily